jgi:hypothetical protein
MALMVYKVSVLLLSGFLVGGKSLAQLSSILHMLTRAACQYGMGRHLKLLKPEDKFETMKVCLPATSLCIIF